MHKDRFFKERRRLFEEDVVETEEGVSYERSVCDFIAGMTDRYAQDLFTRIFMPSPYV